MQKKQQRVSRKAIVESNKPARDNVKLSESSLLLKNFSKQSEKEVGKVKHEKKEQTKNNKEKRTTISDKSIINVESIVNKEKVLTIESYEDDFEDYESDFEEDLKDNDEVNINLEDEDESILRKKLTGKDRLQDFKNEGINDIKMPEQRKLAYSQEQGELSQELSIHRKQSQRNNQEWLVDYFKEVTGQSVYKKQVLIQTEGTELCTYSQTESTGKETVGTQFGKYSKESFSRKAENNAGLALFVDEVFQLLTGLLQETSFSNFEKISSIFSTRLLNLSLNQLFTENCAENKLLTIAYKSPQTICLCIFVAESNDTMLSKKSFIAEFDIESMNQKIERLIYCDQEVVFLRYSPDCSALFGALKDGSLIAWDLLKWQSSTFCETVILVNGISITLLSSDFIFGSFSDEQLSNRNSNWTDFRIVELEVADLFASLGSRVIARLYSLYESGLLRVFHSVIIDGERDEIKCIFEGRKRIELIPVLSIHCLSISHNGIKVHKTYLDEFSTSFTLSDNAIHSSRTIDCECFIGTSRGRILRLDPANIKNIRFYYISQFYQHGLEIVNVKIILSQIFACVTNDRHIFIFDYKEFEPIKFVSFSTPTRSFSQMLFSSTLFEWSPTDKSVFYLISSGEHITVWKDLFNEGMGNIHLIDTYDFYQQFRTRIQCSTVWKNHSGKAFMALGLLNGEVQVHMLNKI